MKKEISCRKNTNENTPVKLSDFQKDQITDYMERSDKQPHPIKFDESKGTNTTFTMVGFSEKNGASAFERRMALNKTTGMLNPVSSVQLINQVALCEEPKSVDETKTALETASALMLEMRPKGAIEGVLIAQMVATHSQAMNCFNRAEKSDLIAHRELYLRFADRFLRTYTTQMEALLKHRRGGQQKVVVEHVHVYEGGQAVVGNIENHQGGGSDEKK